MIQRYLGLGLTAAGISLLGAQLLTIAFKDLPEVRKEEKALKDMSSPEKPFHPKWHKSIIKAVKRRVNAIKANPQREVIVPMKVLGWCMIYFFVGHSMGLSQGLLKGANMVTDRFLGFCEESAPEAFKPFVRSVLDKGIKKTKLFGMVDHGFFKDTNYSVSVSWVDIWKNRYAEEVAKVC